MKCSMFHYKYFIFNMLLNLNLKTLQRGLEAKMKYMHKKPDGKVGRPFRIHGSLSMM